MSGLHHATRVLLREVLTEERQELEMWQRYVDSADKRPNNSGLNNAKRSVERQKGVVADLEAMLKRAASAPLVDGDELAPQCVSHAHPDFAGEQKIRCELPDGHFLHRSGERTWTP